MASRKQSTPTSTTTTTTTIPETVIPQEDTQPVLPQPQTFSPPASSATSVTPQPSGDGVDPRLQQNVYGQQQVGETYKYALGVTGRKVFDDKGNIIRYEGYRYASQRPSPWGPGMLSGVQTPKYFSGDQDSIGYMPVERLVNLQRAMNQIGLLSKNYTVGVVDQQTRSAFTNLLETANFSGEEYEQTILRMAAAGGSQRGNLSQYRVSNPDDVKSVINKVAQQTIGRKLQEGDLDRMARLFLEEERQSARSGSTEVVSAPNVQTFAEQQLEATMPEETQARQFGSYMEAIQQKYGL
jgi:hypothetical protein